MVKRKLKKPVINSPPVLTKKSRPPEEIGRWIDLSESMCDVKIALDAGEAHRCKGKHCQKATTDRWLCDGLCPDCRKDKQGQPKSDLVGNADNG